MLNRNPFLATDVYKLGHLDQYQPGITKVYSYLVARSDKKIPFTVFFGLQYYIKEYLQIKPTKEMVDELFEIRKDILGTDPLESMKSKFYGLVDLGYFPLEIKAVPEGTVMPVKNVILTMTNTLPEYYWLVGFFESLILKVWATTTVASYSKSLKDIIVEFNRTTSDHDGLIPFQVHDFGYRSGMAEESSTLGGAAHLVNFLGTDTVPAVRLLKRLYGSSGPIGLSVPASEHSVMCSFGQENELDAFKHMLKTYPTGIVSIVSDTYNLWNVLENFTEELRSDIEGRDGKVVFRPDSGDPKKIICGDENAPEGSPERLGALAILDNKFGHTVNSKGFKELNPKVGLIYGDGIYKERMVSILETLKQQGWSSNNIVFGIGGILITSHSRDDQGFAIKATHVIVNGVSKEIKKDPITDSGKKSHKGFLKLEKIDGEFVTTDQVSELEEKTGLLELVFKDGVLVREQTLDQIRDNSNRR